MADEAIIPGDVIMPLLEREVLAQTQETCIIGGFPQQVDQVQDFQETTQPFLKVIFLETQTNYS
jgi:adenylate kinase family enzyme